MSEPSEAQLRDAIAGALDQLEPGLTLVATEYPIPNAVGTRARIDILAKDRFGHFVIIEVKRSDSVARQALHELYKYAELLRGERGLNPTDLRCVVVSTAWKELLRPFSAFVRSFEYDCRGFRPELDRQGSLVGFSRVEVLPEPLVRGLTGEQALYLFSTAADRDNAFDAMASALAAVACNDVVGVCLDHPLPPPPFGFPHMLYLAVGQIEGQAPSASVLDDYDDESDSPWRLESRALYYAFKQTQGAIGLEDLDRSTPERFADIVATKSPWTIAAIRRAGAFLQQSDLVSDDDLVEEMQGRRAFNAVSYERRAAPHIASSWRDFRAELERFISAVDVWRRGVSWWLDIAEREQAEEVLVRAFCPCNLPKSLVEGAEHGDTSRRVPALGAASYLEAGGGSPGDGKQHRLLFGELLWDGSAAMTPVQAFGATYKEPILWALFPDPVADNRFLELLGLRYVLLEKGPDGRTLLIEPDGATFHGREHDDVVIEGGQVTLVWNHAERIDDFIQQRAEEVDELVQYLLRHEIARIR